VPTVSYIRRHGRREKVRPPPAAAADSVNGRVLDRRRGGGVPASTTDRTKRTETSPSTRRHALHQLTQHARWPRTLRRADNKRSPKNPMRPRRPAPPGVGMIGLHYTRPIRTSPGNVCYQRRDLAPSRDSTTHSRSSRTPGRSPTCPIHDEASSHSPQRSSVRPADLTATPNANISPAPRPAYEASSPGADWRSARVASRAQPPSAAQTPDVTPTVIMRAHDDRRATAFASPPVVKQAAQPEDWLPSDGHELTPRPQGDQPIPYPRGDKTARRFRRAWPASQKTAAFDDVAPLLRAGSCVLKEDGRPIMP